MDYEGGDLPLSGTACAGGQAAACSLCVNLQAVGGGSLSGLAPLISYDKRIRGALA